LTCREDAPKVADGQDQADDEYNGQDAAYEPSKGTRFPLRLLVVVLLLVVIFARRR